MLVRLGLQHWGWRGKRAVMGIFCKDQIFFLQALVPSCEPYFEKHGPRIVPEFYVVFIAEDG